MLNEENIVAMQLQWYVALHVVKQFTEMELDTLQGAIDKLMAQDTPESRANASTLREHRAEVAAAYELIVLQPMRDLEPTLQEKLPDLERRAKIGMGQFN